MSKWIAEDGLMRVDLAYENDDREPFPGATLRTVHNDNGILYRIVYALLKPETLSKEEFKDIVKRLEHPNIPGLYLRNPMAFEKDEQHDNYAAIAVGCLLYEYPDPMLRTLEHAEKTGWYFEHRKVKITPKNLFRGFRQGGEICLYQIASGRKYVNPFLFLWMLGGILANALRKDVESTRGKNPISDTQLVWMRLEGLKYAKKLAKSYKFMLNLVEKYWVKKMKEKYTSIYHVFQKFYREPEHPIRVIAENKIKEFNN
jgi:hypothetical protein